ncbi:hypothetical protein [Burkholderia aenigmatica]|uniref:hypothetical protein n=1 Tax=Burkholderia aenigmatica TaxID=2015348 RepID=UPI00264AC2A1|nr:hypothetical protein [Burkholderia aenigmatica]MDN7880974.1 hypothetical protein [Burkholderia aenigmatica]
MTNIQDQHHEERAAFAMDYLRRMTGEDPQMTPENAIRFVEQLQAVMRMEAA